MWLVFLSQVRCLAREPHPARRAGLVDGWQLAARGKSACGQPSQVPQATGDVQEEDLGDLGNWKSLYLLSAALS